MASIEELASQWNRQIAAIDAGITKAGVAAPGLIDTTTIVLSLLLILFGAGQLCLLLRGVRALRS